MAVPDLHFAGGRQPAEPRTATDLDAPTIERIGRAARSRVFAMTRANGLPARLAPARSRIDRATADRSTPWSRARTRDRPRRGGTIRRETSRTASSTLLKSFLKRDVVLVRLEVAVVVAFEQQLRRLRAGGLDVAAAHDPQRHRRRGSRAKNRSRISSNDGVGCSARTTR